MFATLHYSVTLHDAKFEFLFSKMDVTFYLLNMRFYIRVRSLKILQRDSHVTHSQFDERRSHWGIFKPQQLPFFSLRFLLAEVSSFVCSAPVFFICSVRFLFAARLRSCLVRVRRGPS